MSTNLVFGIDNRESKEAEAQVVSAQDLLHVKISLGDKHIPLSDFKTFSDTLLAALSAVANNIAQDAVTGIKYEIEDASIGSLSIALRATAPADSPLLPEAPSLALASDLQNIGLQRYRDDLTDNVLRSYRAFVNCMRDDTATIDISCGTHGVVIDAEYRANFTAIVRERVAEDISIVGTLDAVNAHGDRYSFFLYPKLSGFGRITCTFNAADLSLVADILKKKALVQVSGRGYFGPIGNVPSRIDIKQPPIVLTYDREFLRSKIRNLDLVSPGKTVEEALNENREAMGFAD